MAIDTEPINFFMKIAARQNDDNDCSVQNDCCLSTLLTPYRSVADTNAGVVVNNNNLLLRELLGVNSHLACSETIKSQCYTHFHLMTLHASLKG